MYEKTMECADMIMASHGPLWQNTFALCNLVLGRRENYVFFYLITQNIPSHSLFHTHIRCNSTQTRLTRTRNHVRTAARSCHKHLI